jgi:gamma-glutamyltranspeptidase / glutathione hydrolase
MIFPEPEFNSRRSPVMGRGGMVSTSQPLATAAGLEILSKGGNAADAAVAAAAALNVVEPSSTGLGGDMFALFFDSKTGNVSALNGSGRAPASLTLGRLKKEGIDSLPPFHPYTITVPGACAGWCDLIEKHGILSLGEILAPAIRLADEGAPISPLTSFSWQRSAEHQLTESLNGREMTLEGRGPTPGELFHNPGLGRTLRKMAAGGIKAFYEGEIAESIVATIKKAGGCMTEEDLAAHRSTWDTPVSITYQGFRVYECPPNGQGITALIALNILEELDLKGLDPISPERLHLEIEALRLAFADSRWYVADPAVVAIPIQELLSKEYAAQRRKLIDSQHTTVDQVNGSPVASSDTVYLSVVDAFGNACSFINSNYMGFGTGIVPSGWGFTLQNRGHNFSLDPAHPNALAPGKRPYHTIIPAISTRESDGSLYASFGVMGGFMQPQGHVQVFLSLMDGSDPQAALDLPRFCIGVEENAGRVALEKGIELDTMAKLVEMGHPVYPVTGYSRSLFGRGQVITSDPLTGVLTAGSDPRSDGCAMTLI